MPTPGRSIRVAAVQPALRVGDVEYNLRRVEDLVRDAAREHEPDVVVVPEAVTSPNLYARSLRHAARPVDGEPYLLLQRLARELGITVGGGFHAVRGEDCYGTFVLVEPDGAAYLHDKDIPTCWEHNYYTRGNDDGVVDTKLGPVGLVCGWEWSRARTARRLRGRVDLVLGGMCWPSFPDWLLTRPYLVWRERPIQRELARDCPGLMARLTGVPVAMASHVGDVVADSPMMPGVTWRSPMIGETQICDRDGRILGRLTYEDGEGHISAEVDLRGPAPLDRVPDRFWAPLMPLSVHMVWHPYNLHGRVKYRALKLLRRHPWQTATFTDLPDFVPPEQAPDVFGEQGARDGATASGNGRVDAEGAGEAADRAGEDGAEQNGGGPEADPETRWYCEACGWVYDPEEGDPDGGVPAGTAFEEIPDDWMCPVCGARKKDFRALAPGEEVAA